MHWSERWIGHPYEALGRGPDRFDCLGLFLAVQAAEFGRDLDYGLVPIGPAEEETRALHAPSWRRVEVARAGDAVLATHGRGWHVGVALDNRVMLHCTEPASVIEPFRSPRWGKRLEGVYTYVN